MAAIMKSAEPLGLYKAKEAAALLDVSIRTFRRYVEAGKIQKKYIRATLQPRYLGADINRLLTII